MTEPDGRPPFFRTWRALYSAIIVYLAVLITLFALFTWSYNL
jgi:hypothetical protein